MKTQPTSWWSSWWWEIGSVALSLTCMALLVSMLLKSDGMELEKWDMPIQPNSLIAVLTTVAKTAMMVPVASCLSQLKWRHFTGGSTDSLYALQVFDDASRGPWGSFMLLLSRNMRIWKRTWNGEGNAIFAWALAFVTLLALGIDPSAQQILDFPTRQVVADKTALAGEKGPMLMYADRYDSRVFGGDEGGLDMKQLVELHFTMLGAATGTGGTSLTPLAICQVMDTDGVGMCEWDKMTTLSLCSNVQDVTNTTAVACTGSALDESGRSCTYDFNADQDAASASSTITMHFSARSDTSGTTVPVSDLLRSMTVVGPDSDRGSLAHHARFRAIKLRNDVYTHDFDSLYANRNKSQRPPPVIAVEAEFYWCELIHKDVTVFATPLGDIFSFSAYETYRKRLAFTKRINLTESDNPLETVSDLGFGADTKQWKSGDILVANSPSNSTQISKYYLTTKSDEALLNLIAWQLNSTLVTTIPSERDNDTNTTTRPSNALHPSLPTKDGLIGLPDGSEWSGEFGMGGILYHWQKDLSGYGRLSTPIDGIEGVLSRLALLLSNKISSNGSALYDNKYGLLAEGIAYRSGVIWIFVRWKWLILPVAETLIVAGLLVAVMIQGHWKRGHEEYARNKGDGNNTDFPREMSASGSTSGSAARVPAMRSESEYELVGYAVRNDDGKRDMVTKDINDTEAHPKEESGSRYRAVPVNELPLVKESVVAHHVYGLDEDVATELIEALRSRQKKKCDEVPHRDEGSEQGDGVPTWGSKTTSTSGIAAEYYDKRSISEAAKTVRVTMARDEKGQFKFVLA